jgi:hypothetical protein
MLKFTLNPKTLHPKVVLLATTAAEVHPKVVLLATTAAQFTLNSAAGDHSC